MPAQGLRRALLVRAPPSRSAHPPTALCGCHHAGCEQWHRWLASSDIAERIEWRARNKEWLGPCYSIHPCMAARDLGQRTSPSPCLQVFQVSDQCVKLWREGWFQAQEEPAGTSTLRNPKVSAAMAARRGTPGHRKGALLGALKGAPRVMCQPCVASTSGVRPRNRSSLHGRGRRTGRGSALGGRPARSARQPDGKAWNHKTLRLPHLHPGAGPQGRDPGDCGVQGPGGGGQRLLPGGGRGGGCCCCCCRSCCCCCCCRSCCCCCCCCFVFKGRA